MTSSTPRSESDDRALGAAPIADSSSTRPLADPSRRRWLHSSVAFATLAGATAWPGARLCFAQSAPAVAPASSDAERPRLVVVMLRGALDGLAAVPATGDPAWAALRPAPLTTAGSAVEPVLPLDRLFSLHPALGTLHQWWGEGRLLIAHAVASGYRERSHFDAQQLLESGGMRPFDLATGWLGRALAATRGQGVAVGSSLPVALRGADGSTSWSPGRQRPVDDDLMDRIASLYGRDTDLGPAFARAREQRRGLMGAGMADATAGGTGLVELARQAGRILADPRGPSVAWIDSQGWDTHTQQAGRLARQLPQLDQALAAVREGLGPAWARSTLLVMTEFGRSAVLNGSGGTDHGTGTIAWIAGGEVAGGRVWADWPGLASRQLLDQRDLRPTLDIRSVIRPVLQQQFRLTDAVLDRDVLPGTAEKGSVPVYG
jgi:uncharacterized protein (DUF1501 family)